MDRNFDTIIVTTADDLRRVLPNLNRLSALLPGEKLIFIGSEEVGKIAEKENSCGRFGFINENDLLPFEDVRNVFKSLLNTVNVPRGLVGWYYQQFLKMKYASVSEHEFYLSWDGDTVPTKAFSMFSPESGKPYFDLKYEYHEEYFVTFKNLFHGAGKAIGKSFISEHMLFNREIMKEMISMIEKLDYLEGDSFYERILRAVRPEALQSNSFSEFETYGTFVAFRHPSDYALKDWHSIRYGSIYFKPEELTDEDYEWLSRDFDAVSFEKNQPYNSEIAAIFTDPRYREKLTARQMIEAIQDSSEGMREEWEK